MGCLFKCPNSGLCKLFIPDSTLISIGCDSGGYCVSSRKGFYTESHRGNRIKVAYHKEPKLCKDFKPIKARVAQW